MKFKNLKLFFLFLIVLIISQSVFCQENDGKVDNHPTETQQGPADEVTTTAQINTTEVTTQPTSHVSPSTSPRVTTPPTTQPTTPPTTKPPVTTQPSTKPTSSNPTPTPSDPIVNPGQPSDVPQQQPDQGVIGGSQTTNPLTDTTNDISTINTTNKPDNKKDDDNVPVIYIFLGVGIILVLVAAVVGFIFAVQKKKKNNERLSPNMWSVPDDFDSRINPVAQPANTYNMNNVPMSQPPMSQPMYQNSYGQAQVMPDAYNQVQTGYVDQNDMQMAPSNGVAVPIDNAYPNDYNNGGAMEYIPTSVDELKVNNVYTSQFTFQPELDDEIEINIDDQIYIEEIFADNWALGVNTSTNARGCFPLNIFLNPKSTLDNSRSQRTLSYCSSGNGQPY